MVFNHSNCFTDFFSSLSPPNVCVVHHTVSVWPRLQSSVERPPWLRVDFDHWEDLSDDGEEGEGGEEEEKTPMSRERLAEIKEKQVCVCVGVCVCVTHSLHRHS